MSAAGACDFVPGAGSCDLVPAADACGHVPAADACDHVPAAGSGSGSRDLMPAADACDHVSDFLVEMSRQDMGYQKRQFTTISNWGENVTQILRGFPVIV